MRVLSFLLVIILNAHCGHAASKGVNVILSAKWPATPLLLETSEFIAEDGEEKFWQFVDTVRELTVYKGGESVRSYYNLILKKAGQFVTDLQVNLLKFALSLRIYSPAVQVFQQIAADEPPPANCTAFVSVHGKHTCSTKEVKKLLKTAAGRCEGKPKGSQIKIKFFFSTHNTCQLFCQRPKPYLFKFDHTFPGTNGSDLPVVILYAEIGTNKFNTFHKLLSERARDGKIIYVLRHFVVNTKMEKMHLSGYSVELAIKSTEYKAVDDTQVKDANSTVSVAEDESDDVQGFIFATLKKAHPELKEQLSEFRKHLIESSNDMAPLKVWELQDLSFQAAAWITSVPKYDALKMMRDISQNFPIKARSVTRTVVNQEMRREIEENQKFCYCSYCSLHPRSTAGNWQIVPEIDSHRLGILFKTSIRIQSCLMERTFTWKLFFFFQYLSEKLGIQPGEGGLFINGLHIDLDMHNPFSILDIIRREGKVMEGLHNLGIKDDDLSKLLRLNIHPLEDNFALDIRHPAIMWVNDIEKDHIYQTWPSSCQELLRATFPGVIRQIRRNFFNLVLFIDPSQEDTVELVKLAELFYQHNIPLRIGFVFVVNTDDKVDGYLDAGVALFRVLNYIVEKYDFSQAFMSMVSIYNKVDSGESLTVDIVVEYLKKKFPSADVPRILGIESVYDDKRKAGGVFYRKSGLSALPQALFNGIPFRREEMDPDDLETNLLQRIMDTTTFFQRAVFMVQLSDDADVVEFLMDQSNVVPRINPLILSKARSYLDLTSRPAVQDWQDTVTFSYLDSRDKSAVISENMKYITKNEEDVHIYGVTIWIVADFDKPPGRRLLSNALKHMVELYDPGGCKPGPLSPSDFDQDFQWLSTCKHRVELVGQGSLGYPHLCDLCSVLEACWLVVLGKSSPNTRIGVINNPTAKPTEENSLVARAIWATLLTQKRQETFPFITKLIKEENIQLLAQGTKLKDLFLQGMDKDSLEKRHNTIGVDFIRTQQLFCRDVLKLLPGQMAVVSNGRVLGPFEEKEELHPEDFQLLEKITLSTSAEKVKVKIKQMNWKGKQASDLVMKVDALLTSAHKGESRKDIRFIKDELSVVQIPPREDEVFYHVVAIVDPVSREAQKMSSLLIVLSQVINMKLQVFMNCKSKLSEMPLKGFYRFVLEPDVSFLANNSLSPGPVAKFVEMPESPLFTLNMITPESWLVESVRSFYDLDNIHLQEINGFVTAEYELEYLLLEGHCFDITTGQPPRGLQFTLGTKTDLLMQDTIVMANLGYFQLKANPGAWTLRLRKGRSEDIYQILAHDGTDSPAESDDVIVVLNSFHSKIIKVQVQKKADKVNEDLLSDGTEDRGVWESLTSLWKSLEKSITGGSKSEDAEDKKEDVLNIFSLASGHLYERFLRIMMLSVLRHTKTPVKFWFLKNYLSPMFKESIPLMAKAYGFQYELVQYKWPRWLHQQTEKQRIIWGYKILFLDVLFPLAVDKIIFVDADQIVRTNLKELRDLDLEGAPYGYTPFCDSRKDMDGYRFWKSGYWASHLGNRKYHISALYVVDLKKFRKIAAGDRLRGQYQALSQDPNSLSNLDQDLPNNMIHQVAIKSLPLEWLWCETWCDDNSKSAAKTIDLCNNPKTKEPKLKAAMRIVPEWMEYDTEIKQLLKHAEDKNLKDTSQSARTKNKRGKKRNSIVLYSEFS
ncbi:UGGG1 glucosyltransferase, partial [Atractosteus spatula]|nr:UGGG1 glucosyltransferase [Atractosteus spatula]